MKREFKSGEVVLEVYDASLRIVMDRLLPPYEDNGDFIIEGLISKGNNHKSNK